MESEERQNLKALEAILDEFFSPTTSNERKREIEKLLENFSQQSSTWKECLYFLNHSNNQYVSMFSLTTLEGVIHRKWIGMLGSERAEIRTSLNRFLYQHHKSAPNFIRNKLMKLIVDIARSDWPHFYPDFFPQIMSLVQNTDTMALGLGMLLTASEELATPRDDISTSRAHELKRLMNQQAANILSVLTNLLETVLDKDKSGAAAAGFSTPPPSPSLSGDSEDSNSMDGSMFTASPLHTGSLLHVASTKVLASHGRKPSPGLVPSLDQDSVVVCSLCLKCLGHMLTWAPLSSTVTPRLSGVVFQMASLEVKSAGSSGPGLSEISVLAMCVLCEIMSKNFVPHDLQDYLMITFRNTFQLLQSLVQEPEGPNKLPYLCRLDINYLEKITEFLRLFVCFHFGRCESSSQFPLIEFLAIFFKYTFQQPTLAGYYGCLEVWCAIIDYIQGTIELTRDGKVLLDKYQEALLSLVVEIVKKVQFQYNAQQLKDLDMHSVGDDNETEWQQFLRVNIETVMKVADLLPLNVLRIIDGVWKESSTLYFNIDKLIVAGPGSSRHLVIASQEDTVRLHHHLRDFSSVLQMIGRVSSLFLGGCFQERLQIGLDYIKQLLTLATFESSTKAHTCADIPEIKENLIEVHAQTLAALKAWCHWLATLHSESLIDSNYTWLCSDLTSRIVAAVVTVIKDGDTDKLVHSAGHFMVTLTGTVRPPSIWKLKDFTDLYAGVHHLKLQPDSYRLIVRSLCNVLLLHWPGIQEQKWDDRRKHLSKFLKDLTPSFRNLKDTPGFLDNKDLQRQAEPTVVHTLQMLGDLVENVLNEMTQTKKLCYDATREYIETSLWLFPAYVHNAKVCEQMFNFFHTVFDVLKAQMGSEFVEQSIHTFLSLFGQNQMAEVIGEASSGSRVVEKFLSILMFIVSEPGTAFRKFIPSTLSLCLDHIYPLVADKPAADIKGPLFTLLYQTLLHNWQYFFKSNVKMNLGAAGKLNEEVNDSKRFLEVLKAIGQSFLQPDIAVFKQNVEALEHLNAKWKLYHKRIFIENLLGEFLTVFLQVLISRSHNLLREEVGVAVYNMAAVDFSAFFSKFIPQFLSGLDQLDDNQRQILSNGFKTDTDLPSFTTSLDRFVTDLRYYRLCNASLPDGSVKF